MDSGMDAKHHTGCCCSVLQLHFPPALRPFCILVPSQIFVLEPFLFDTPQYLKSWMGTLEEVRGMIRQTVASVLPAFFSLCTDSGFHVTPDHMSAYVSRIQTVQNSFCRIHLLPTQPLLDDAVQRSGIPEITKDGIHLAQEGHHVLAVMIVKKYMEYL